MTEDDVDVQRLLRQLLTLEANTVREWITQVWAGERSVPADFNWHGLAEVATSNARAGSDLQWAEIATTVYDRLANDAGPTHGDSFNASAMHLRAWMIARHGPRLGHPVLDLEPVVGWVRESLVMMPDEAVRLATSWHEAGFQEQRRRVDEARVLRRIKNRLAVLAEVVVGGTIPLSADLQAWLAIRTELP